MYKAIERSQTLLINTQSKRLIDQGREVIKFGFGQSPFLPPPAVIKVLSESAHHKEYSSVQGDEKLRHLISSFHKSHNGLESKPDDILIAPGSKILLFNLLLAYQSLDVLLPAPSWVSYEPQVRLAGHNSIRIPTSYEKRWRIDAEDIKAALVQKRGKNTALILNYPGNPDGLTYSQSELEDIVSMARKNDILIISDEIYGLLDHHHTHRSIAHFYPEKTITTTGLSKWCGAGGWRLGVALLSPGISTEYKETLLALGSETYSCAPMPIQIAACKAYESYEKMIPYLSYQTDILSKISEYCTSSLNRIGIKTHTAQGGFYLFPTFTVYQDQLIKKGIDSSTKLAERLLEEIGVATLPAAAFGMNDGLLALRLAYVDFDESTINKSSFSVEKDCPKIVEGIQKIEHWIQKL